MTHGRHWPMPVLVVLPLALALAASFCSPAQQAVQSARSVDARPVLTIAGTGPGDDVAFSNPTGAARLSNGEIAVADGSSLSPAIVFFDSLGRKVRSVGRSGTGPSDFRIISWMAQCGTDALYAYDLMLRRVTVLAGSGAFARQFRLPVQGGLFGCSRSGMLAIVGAPPRFTETSPALRTATAPLALYDARGAEARAFGEVPVWDLAYTDFGGWLPLQAGRIPSVAVSNDRLYVGPSDSSAVLVFALNGGRLPSLPVRVPRREPSRRHLERWADLMVSFAPASELRDRMRARFLTVTPAENLPPFSSLTVDPDGVVWVNLSVPGDTAAVLRALDAGGRVLGDVRIPVELKVFEIGRDYVLGAYEEPSGEPVVALYRLRRGN